MSKEFISAKEAAVLLNCSERHIHNLVDRARRQIDDNSIPFRKIGETTSFLRTELLEWTKGQSSADQLRAVS
jgi:excisionase family DNA binding protein